MGYICSVLCIKPFQHTIKDRVDCLIIFTGIKIILKLIEIFSETVCKRIYINTETALDVILVFLRYQQNENPVIVIAGTVIFSTVDWERTFALSVT